MRNFDKIFYKMRNFDKIFYKMRNFVLKTLQGVVQSLL